MARTDCENFVWVGDGVTLVRSTDADWEMANGNLRPGDAEEHAAALAAKGGAPTPERMESAWTIRDGADVLGYIGLLPFDDESLMSRSRMVVMLSTREVDRRKVKYVRWSRAVFAAVAERAPKWVDGFYTYPLASYRAAVKWLKRVLRFRVVEERIEDGAKHLLMGISRKEAVSWHS